MKPYYEHGGITIYHGKCEDILPILGTFDLMIADPPYNVALGSAAHSTRQSGYASHDDNLTKISYEGLLSPVINKILDCACVFITPGNSNQHLWPKPKWTMAWTKSNGVTRTPLTRGQAMNHACWEPILVYGKLANPPHSDVINLPISIQPECEGHPCPKPLKLFSRLISFTDAKTVLDPFAGSFTTARAAKDLNIKCVCIEKEESYCELGARRMEQEVFSL